MHQRRIIRNGIADAIRDAETDAQDRVWPSREAPGNVESLIEEGPIVLVYTRRDTIKPEDYPKSGFDGGVMRCLEVAVEITAAGSWVVDDKLDDLAEAIEGLLEDWTPTALPATEVRLVSTEIDSTDEFEQPLGGALLMFEARYWRPFRTDKSPTFFPDEVFSSPNGTPPALVATCALCSSGECPH